MSIVTTWTDDYDEPEPETEQSAETQRILRNYPYPLILSSMKEDPCMYFYPATNTFIGKALGFMILLFWALHNWFDVVDGDKKSMRMKEEEDCFLLVFCRRYSRFSLTAYVVHQLVLHWPLFLAELEGRRTLVLLPRRMRLHHWSFSWHRSSLLWFTP